MNNWSGIPLVRTISTIVALIVFFVLAAFSDSQAQSHDRNGRPERVKERASCANCTSAKLYFELGSGEINLSAMTTPDSAGVYATADIFYNPQRIRYTWEPTQSGSVANLDTHSEHRPGRSYNDDDNNWDIKLSKSLPLNLDMEIGAADALLDLGGLKIEKANLEIGAASAEVTFQEENPVSCREFQLKSGAASVSITQFANLHAAEATIEIGAAKLDLDLGGKQKGETHIDLSVGVGSSKVTVPLDLALRVEGAEESWFSNVGIPRNRMHKVSRGVYKTDSYDAAKDRVVIDLSVGMGSVNFKFR